MYYTLLQIMQKKIEESVAMMPPPPHVFAGVLVTQISRVKNENIDDDKGTEFLPKELRFFS